MVDTRVVAARVVDTRVVDAPVVVALGPDRPRGDAGRPELAGAARAQCGPTAGPLRA